MNFFDKRGKNSRPPGKSVLLKFIILISQSSICFGCSKEPSNVKTDG